MSRVKLRNTLDCCADCGALDPSWASVNRGILICDECCSVHRSLGRHISQVKSLKKGTWSASQMAMVHALHASGANNIWEHSLLDPSNAKSGRRKPQSKDPVHPIKADFVRAKHQMLAFVFRPNGDTGDASKQLHSSVRTANLETSLRLLSQGADPNYFHSEKGTYPLHVAARAGQVSQVELLLVYGADPGALDFEGKSPIDYARLAGHEDVANRLFESQYELTDRLSYYLCGRKPDHSSGQHFLIPEMADSLDLSEFAKAAQRKLQALSHNLFEELAMDVYDEVDRRETDGIWLSLQNQSALLADRCSVPFLPVNPELSSTRNQGRQKLARFNARELATLIIDVLLDARRRQMGPVSQIQSSERNNGKHDLSDEEPLYDSVASDEDFVAAEQQAFLAAQTKSSLCDSNGMCEKKVETTIPKARSSEDMNGDSKSKSSKRESIMNSGSVTWSKYESMRRQLCTSEAQVQRLIQSNSDLKQEIALLQRMVHQLIQENADLRSTLQHAGIIGSSSTSQIIANGHDTESESPATLRSPRTSSQRPASMYEPREGGPRQVWKGSSAGPSSPVKWEPERPLSALSACGDGLPVQATVFAKTEQITRRIQKLLIAAQEKSHEAFVPCAHDIRAAVHEMVAIFPPNAKDEAVVTSLRNLLTSSVRLHSECSVLLQSDAADLDYGFIAQQVIQCAYDIAKAAKQIVTMYQ